MVASARRTGTGGHLAEAERLSLAELLKRLRTSAEQGLSEAEAARRLRRDGPNEVPPPPRATWFRLAWGQLTSLMNLVLLAATAISFALGEWLDGWSILAIAALNVTLGVVQEYRAEKAMQAIARIGAPTARVVRSGSLKSVPARNLVVGDMVCVEAGDRVPADCRIVESFALQVEESALTGESVPTPKWACAEPDLSEAAPTERPHVLLMGTTVTSGNARAVVVRTGSFTELGAIARLVSDSPSGTTPLQQSLEHLGRWLVVLSGAAVAAVFSVGVAQGQPWLDMLFVAVSLAVAAIPEGLPATVTVALALGVLRMSRRGAIIRRLSAVETLGCASVICSDKTGTLTLNQMVLTRAWAAWGELEVRGDGFRPEGSFSEGGREVRPAAQPLWAEVLTALAAASRGDVAQAEDGRWVAVGDPTEAALNCAVRKAGLQPARLVAGPKVAEAPFEPQRRMMSVAILWPGEPGARVYAKGAPDAILDKCRGVRTAEGDAPLDGAWRRRIAHRADAMASEGLRVLAVATGRLPAAPSVPFPSGPEAALALERDLTFLALIGLQDPPRPDVPEAVEAARRAGVRTLMVTGDHPRTAMAVARAIGLAGPEESPVLGSEMGRMTDAELQEVALRHHVFARVSPADKRRLVQVLRQAGRVVAMTGDGVNDAPALKEADIGVAMGRTGTDVARQAASMVLQDDSYSTIVQAIEEGRTIYDNIRRFIRYLLGCNAGEVLAMLAAGVLGWPVPLSPLQILCVNLVTDGLPALALGMLPPSKSLMRRPPRPRAESLFARGSAEEIAEQGLLIGASTALLFGFALAWGLPLERARTLAFTSLVASQLMYALICAAQSGARFERLRPVLLAVGLSWGMQLAVLALPPLQPLFETVWPSPPEWGAVLVASGGTLGLRYASDAAWRLCRRLFGGVPRLRPWLLASGRFGGARR